MVTIEPRTSIVTIFQGDYLDRIRHLEQRHAAAVKAEKAAGPRVLSEVPESHTLAEEHAALVEEAEASALDVVLKALGRKAWRELVAQHPPREGHEGDKEVGVDESTFKDALISASIVSPEMSEDDLDLLSDADNDRLYLTAFALNRGMAAGPKALPASPPNPENDKTSN